jgi:hypothetical protein
VPFQRSAGQGRLGQRQQSPDAMSTERLQIAVDITASRTGPGAARQDVIDDPVEPMHRILL